MGRRAITTSVTMVVLCSLLVVAAVWGWRSLFAEIPGDGNAVEVLPGSCPTERLSAGHRLRSSQVQVSVFNGGTESGLADTTSAALSNRGFRTADVGNAPSSADVRRVQVWSTREKDAGARLVARQFGRKVRVKLSEEDLGPGVDVLVGNGLRRLAPAARAIEIRTAQDVCISSKGS